MWDKGIWIESEKPKLPTPPKTAPGALVFLRKRLPEPLFFSTDGFHRYTIRIRNGKIYFRCDYSQYLTALDVGNVDQGKANIVGFGDFSAYAQSQIELKSFGYHGNYGLELFAPEGYIFDMDDLLIFIENWLGINCTCPDFCEGSDINQDGRVDLIDFSIVCEQWLEYLGSA